MNYGKKKPSTEPTPPPKDPKDWTNSESSRIWGKQFALANNKAKQAAIRKAREGSSKKKMKSTIDKVVGY